MKVTVELKPGQQLILFAMFQKSGGDVLEYELRRVVEAVESQDEFQQFLQILLGVKPTPRLGWNEKEPKSQFEWDLEGLIHMGLVAESEIYSQPFISTKSPALQLTEEGKRVAKGISDNRQLRLRPKKESLSTVFVACAFGDAQIDSLYQKVFEPVVRSLNYEPVRIDMKEPEGTISDAVSQSIMESACIIADLTHARPSVYFEVGFAHGLGVPLCLTCRSDHRDGIKTESRVHFNLEQYKISYWSMSTKGIFRWGKNQQPESRLKSLISKRSV